MSNKMMNTATYAGVSHESRTMSAIVAQESVPGRTSSRRYIGVPLTIPKSGRVDKWKPLTFRKR